MKGNSIHWIIKTVDKYCEPHTHVHVGMVTNIQGTMKTLTNKILPGYTSKAIIIIIIIINIIIIIIVVVVVVVVVVVNNNNNNNNYYYYYYYYY